MTLQSNLAVRARAAILQALTDGMKSGEELTAAVLFTSLWKSQKLKLSSKHIQAMVGLAGEGKLCDGGKASEEFCLTYVPSPALARYTNECLSADSYQSTINNKKKAFNR